MRKDFANSSARKQPTRKGGAKKGRKKKAPSRWFHAPSFSGGMILGALLVLSGAYLPELLPYVLASDTSGAITSNNPNKDAATQPQAEVTFEFDDMLRNDEVDADGSLYVDPEVAAQAKASPTEYLLQAASFRDPDDADTLRAGLLLDNMPASTDIVSLASGRWYRVTVGPFPSRTQAQRVVTELRERNLSPMWIKRKVDLD